MALPPVPDSLEIRPSPIHGLGVFATHPLPANHCLGEFIGIQMNHQEFKKLYGNDRQYCARKRRTWEYRVAKENRNFITYINDGKHFFRINRVNCYIKNWFLYTLRSVQAGEELMLDYGNDYPWNK
jgi:SET domain-containing protein